MVSEIHVNQSEQAEKRLDPASLATALSLLDENGYVVLHNAVPGLHLLALKDIYDSAWQTFRSTKPTWIGGGRLIGHLNVNPPASAHFANSEVLGNALVQSLTTAVLGPGMRIGGVGGNTNEPGSVDQYFHSDVDFKETSKLLVNIPLGDVDIENGSIELVPKSHRSDIQFPDAQDLNGAQPPVRISTKIGSVLIRYPHLWHRGRANPSVQPRHMLSAWHRRATTGDGAETDLAMDPADPDLLAAFSRRLAELGQPCSEPEFCPNYFAPGWRGLVRESFYKYAPGAYLSVLRHLKKFR